MSSPYEYREVLRASFNFGESRSVEEVLAEQERRHKTPKNGKGPSTPARPATVQQSEVDKVKALLAKGAQAQVAGE